SRSARAGCRRRSCPAAISSSSPSPARSAIGGGRSNSSPACARPASPALPTAAPTHSKACTLRSNQGWRAPSLFLCPSRWIDKAATFALAHEIGGEALLDVLVEDTHTCYLGDRSQRHDWGYGCGTCPACRLRADGFAKWMSTR